jgi:hypothetical protein
MVTLPSLAGIVPSAQSHTQRTHARVILSSFLFRRQRAS